MNHLKESLVALFLPSLRGGGAERVMVNLAQGFYERGLRVNLVLAKAEGSYLAEVPEGIRIVDLGTKRVLYALPGLVRYLYYERPSIVISTLSHANIIAIWARALARIPCSLVLRETNTLTLSLPNAQNFSGKIMPFLIRCFYRYANVIVANSQGAANDLAIWARVPRERIKVIYNPVLIPKIFSKADEPFYHPWFQPDEPPVILGVGRLTKQKDFSTLIRAFALVRREMTARLIILGEGEDRPKLEALVQKLGLEADVALPGFVENPYKYMKRASLFVLSSQWEGLPSVLIEALVVGIPVVATDCPSGPSEILEGGRWGYLVRVGDWEGMALAMQKALEKRLSLEEISARQAMVQERFGLHKIVQEYLEALL